MNLIKHLVTLAVLLAKDHDAAEVTQPDANRVDDDFAHTFDRSGHGRPSPAHP